MGCLRSMHQCEDLISWLQDEVRTRDQELTAADDGCQGTLARQWQVGEFIRGLAAGTSPLAIVQVNARDSQQKAIPLVTGEATITVEQ